MREEIKVFARKPICKIIIILLAIMMLFTYLQMPNTSTYDLLYEKYHNALDLYAADNGAGAISFSDASSYLYDQISYLNEIEETVQHRIDIIKGQMQSSLFQDDLDTLQKELKYEQGRKEANITFENTYYDESLITDHTIVYLLYIIGFLCITSLFFEDIQNQNIHLYRTTETHLSGLFINKLCSYIEIIFLMCALSTIIEILLCKGNYSVYCLSSLSNAFTNMTLKQYIIYKYFQCFVCILLVTCIYLLILLISRNYVFSIIMVAILGFAEYIAYGYITETSALMPFKYVNLIYWLFYDNGQFFSIRFFSQCVKGLSILFFIALLFFVYTKELHNKPLLKKHFSLCSVNPFTHFFYELFIEAKGFIAIAVILLYSFFNIYSFQITKDSKEEFYQSFKANYLGVITENKYQKICQDYEEINEAYEQAQYIYQQATNDPQNASQLYEENKDILESARYHENIARLKTEYEEAMNQGVQTFVDNRAANILFMKDQIIFFLQSMLVFMIPLVTVCFYHHILVTQKERILLINTSSLGIKVTKKCNRICYFMLIVTCTILYTALHIYKVIDQYPINFTNTLKDLLILDISIPVWLAIVLCMLCMVMVTYLLIVFVTNIFSKFQRYS